MRSSTIIAALVGGLLCPQRLAAAEPPPTVVESNGVYTVHASFSVAQSAQVIWSVLTDYEQIPRFMPGVRRSTVRQRSLDHAVVEQEAVASLMMFSKRVDLMLDITKQPDALVFIDRGRRSFKRYAGAWHLHPEPAGVVVEYELVAEPAFDVPGFVLTRLLKRDSSRMIESLKKELASRALLPGFEVLAER